MSNRTFESALAPTWGMREIIAGIILYLIPLMMLFAAAQLVRALQLDPPPEIRPVLRAGLLLVIEGLLLLPVWLMAIVTARGSWQALGFRSFDVGLGCALPAFYLMTR